MRNRNPQPQAQSANVPNMIDSTPKNTCYGMPVPATEFMLPYLSTMPWPTLTVDPNSVSIEKLRLGTPQVTENADEVQVFGNYLRKAHVLNTKQIIIRNCFDAAAVHKIFTQASSVQDEWNHVAEKELQTLDRLDVRMLLILAAIDF